MEKIMTVDEKNQIVRLLKEFLKAATVGQDSVNYARNMIINYVEKFGDEKFQEGVNFAVEVISKEIGVDFDELVSLF